MLLVPITLITIQSHSDSTSFGACFVVVARCIFCFFSRSYMLLFIEIKRQNNSTNEKWQKRRAQFD